MMQQNRIMKGRLFLKPNDRDFFIALNLAGILKTTSLIEFANANSYAYAFRVMCF
jgi:hypothetical protein